MDEAADDDDDDDDDDADNGEEGIHQRCTWTRRQSLLLSGKRFTCFLASPIPRSCS